MCFPDRPDDDEYAHDGDHMQQKRKDCLLADKA